MRLSGIAVALICTSIAAASQAQTPTSAPAPLLPLSPEQVQAANAQSVEDARHGRYLAASFGLLASLRIKSAADIKDPDVFDQWAQVMSCMTGVPTFNPTKSADFHVPPNQLADLRSARGVAAIPEIVRRARQTRIVILDENHLDPRGRAFGLEVAHALRPLGFTVLAVEALKRDADDAASLSKMAKLSTDGYVRQSSGYYLDDPVFADFLRQSLSLGYRLVSYETARTEYAKDPEEAQAQREQDQAEALVARALHQYPGEKVLIYAGEHHIAERPIAAEGGKVVLMAERLKRITGIDPLTIDQAGLSPIPMNRPDADLYAVARSKSRDRSVVLMRHGEPLTVGLLAGSVDLQVVHPNPNMRKVGGRPAWLLDMGRKPTPIPQAMLPKPGTTRLVQAFVAREVEDAIPIDQVLVTAGDPVPMLMLPSVPIRYNVEDLESGNRANRAAGNSDK